MRRKHISIDNPPAFSPTGAPLPACFISSTLPIKLETDKTISKPVFSLCRGLEASHSYHTPSAADSTSASVWPALWWAHHRGNKRTISSKPGNDSDPLKKKERKKKKGRWSRGAPPVVQRPGRQKRWFSISSLALLAHWPCGKDSEVCEMGDSCGV